MRVSGFSLPAYFLARYRPVSEQKSAFPSRILLLSCLLPLSVGALQLDHVPPTLQGVPVPAVPGLLDGPRPIVTNKTTAIQLGKALFWDMAVGSDGMACASCHFHAGADRRTRNQLDPGTRHDAPTGKTFQPTVSGRSGGPDYGLRARDFPFFRLSDPANKRSRLLYSTDDVVSSSGVFIAGFQSINSGGAEGSEQCQPGQDSLFHIGRENARRVSTRNAPTIINSAYNYRSFWDGRANNLFNGETPYGLRDPVAGVWILENGKVTRVRLMLQNASLASQAVAPPLDDREMACSGRLFSALGRKLLQRRPLAHQVVHPEDSVLAPLRYSAGKGLATTYDALIRGAFDARFWAGSGDFGKPNDPQAPQAPGSQMEANFAFFFGLAIQLYEATLLSDASPFDAPRAEDGFPRGFTEQQKRGHILFDKAECDFCHHGPTFSLASHPATYTPSYALDPLKLVDRRVLNIDRASHRVTLPMMDAGFANTSVTPSEFDPGLGASDPYGFPLSFADQYRQTLLDPARSMVDPIAVSAERFSTAFGMNYQADELVAPLAGLDPGRQDSPDARIPTALVAQTEIGKPGEGRLALAVRGAFKTPTLRNVELTGPYMHNGGMKSLREVIEFYDRGGNLENPEHFGTFVFQQHFTQQEKDDLLAFLLTLTDERVRWERAPFDHPGLDVPHGGLTRPDVWPPTRDGRYVISVPAVGRKGRPERLGPLKAFSDYLN